MKSSKSINDITFEIYGKKLIIVSKMILNDTDDFIRRNILIILNPRITVAVVEKFPPTFNTFIRLPKSEAITISISKLFHIMLKYVFPNPNNFINISTLKIKENSEFNISE
jgi:hypothetical protein